jgi:hypothetical protein
MVEESEYIKHVSSASESVQIAAVKQNGHLIKYIKNPSEAVLFAAVSAHICNNTHMQSISISG